MADQAITGLPVKTKSGIAATDYMLGIDSAEGYQMLIKDLGDYIIQTVQSNLIGSNQTLAAALNALNSNGYKLTLPSTAIPENSDLNIYTTPGNFYTASSAIAASLSHCPSSQAGTLRVEATSGSGRRQIYKPYDALVTYERFYASSVWGSWEQVPTRGELNALEGLKTVYKGTISSAAAVNIPAGSAHTIYIVGVGNWNAARLVAVFPNRDGAPIVRDIANFGATDWASQQYYSITQYNTWGFTITSASATITALTVLAIIRSV